MKLDEIIKEQKSKITVVMILLIGIIGILFYVPNEKCESQKTYLGKVGNFEFVNYHVDECKDLFGGPFFLLGGLVMWAVIRARWTKKLMKSWYTEEAMNFYMLLPLVVFLIGLALSFYMFYKVFYS